MQENVKKCKNFLATLIKLASHNSPSPDTSKNVKALVQDLLVSRPVAICNILTYRTIYENECDYFWWCDIHFTYE